MAARAKTLLLLLPALLVPALAFAQDPAASSAPPAQPSPNPTATPAPPATGSAPAPPAGPVTGYGWSDGRAPAPARRYVRPSGPIAVLPGFNALADGSSLFFVQLTKAVPVEEHKAKGTITYVLKGAHVAVYNNERPLVTVHFNTPVWRARLVPRGNDLHFILEMRADVTPTWKMNTAASGMATLEVDLPAGSFLASDMPEMPPTGARPSAGPAATTH